MKYIKNLPSTDKKISEKLILDGWARLKEPSSITKTILSVDCFNILLILKQVPKDSYIVSNGSETYFKKNNY